MHWRSPPTSGRRESHGIGRISGASLLGLRRPDSSQRRLDRQQQSRIAGQCDCDVSLALRAPADSGRLLPPLIGSNSNGHLTERPNPDRHRRRSAGPHRPCARDGRLRRMDPEAIREDRILPSGSGRPLVDGHTRGPRILVLRGEPYPRRLVEGALQPRPLGTAVWGRRSE